MGFINGLSNNIRIVIGPIYQKQLRYYSGAFDTFPNNLSRFQSESSNDQIQLEPFMLPDLLQIILFSSGVE